LKTNTTQKMPRSYLTYSRDLGDFKFDLIELSKAGLHGLRLIFKGKSTADYIQRVREILAFSREHKLNLHLLLDLPGEKAMIGNLGGSLQIEKDITYNLCREYQPSGENDIPCINFLERVDPDKVFPGDIISIADGEVEMKIVSMSEDTIQCIALNSFLLTSNRSFNIKGNKLPASPVSRQDQQLLEELKQLDIAGEIKILVSFVSMASQVRDLKNSLPGFHLVAKIEQLIPEQELEDIIRISDSLMLGRGDLISSTKMSAVFPFQKLVIEKCREQNKELILATGIFASLKGSSNPSIADIMDFAFLRNQGVDSFLITGTNANHYPFETLKLITNFEKMD
jgi:pyruvate kinase